MRPPPKPPRPKLAATVRADYNPTEVPTGKRDERVSAMHQLIGIFDELDETHRELLVRIGHELLRSQQKSSQP